MASSSSQAGPEKIEAQFVGSAPGSPGRCPGRGGRHQYQSRLGSSRDERDATNQGCSSDVWLTTRSMTSRMPRACSASTSVVEVGQRAERRVDAAVVADVVAVVVLRRRVDRREPHDVDAEALEVVEVPGDAHEVADAVTVGVGEAARVHLVHDGTLPPRLAGGTGGGRRRGEGRGSGDGPDGTPAARRGPGPEPPGLRAGRGCWSSPSRRCGGTSRSPRSCRRRR